MISVEQLGEGRRGIPGREEVLEVNGITGVLGMGKWTGRKSGEEIWARPRSWWT